MPDLTFEANYDKATYNTINAITTSKFFKLQFGDAGSGGIFCLERWS